MATALAPGVTGSISLASPANNTSADPSRPDQKSAAYLRMAPRWAKCRALMAGTDAIREGEEDYLPRFENETDDSYSFRQQLVAVANGFARTVFACVGLVLQQPPKLGDDMPQAIKDLWENIDAAGTHGDVFARELFLNAMVDGHVGILVDYQNADDPNLDRSRASAAAVPGVPLSDDDERRIGLRPFWVKFEAPDILLMLYELVNSVRTLTLLILRETVDRRKPPFGIETVTRYRIYALTGAVVSYEVWETTDGQSTPRKNGETRTMRNVVRIPFVFFPAGQKLGPGETKPPLLDLADLNIEHHQIKTDIRNLESRACVPTPVRIGAQPILDESDPRVVAGEASVGDYPPLVLGPGNTIEAPHIEGIANPVYWLTPDVSVLEPAMKTLANNEAAQGAAGLAFLTPETRAAETAEAKRIDSTAQNATLSSVARNGQDALETAAGFTGDYLRVTAGSVTVNVDFEQTVMDAPTIGALGSLAANGKLSIETLLTLLEKGKILADGFDIPAELERILKENAPPPTDPNADSLPDGSPPGGKRPTKATITDTATGKTHTIVTE
jgi:hypothetical protein